MKFGNSLFQRSVAQWRSYNIDYASVKQLIKDNTTPGNGKAVAIPGQGDTVAREFAQLLFLALGHECERVTMFVKSKCYEINSRLSRIERKLSELPGRNGHDPRRGTLQTRRKLSRIETDILAVGEEIENLSRFIAINRLAVRKLLKKDRKWTGQTALSEKVEEQIINQPGSFARVDLKPALDHYSTYLDVVRNLEYDKKDYGGIGVETLVPASPDATPFISYDGANSPLEFDTELASSQNEGRGKDATYWVHVDNVVQLRILLLQYLRYAKSAATLDSAQGDSAIESEKRLGVLLLDDPGRLRAHMTDMVNKDKEEEKTLNNVAVTACWLGEEDAMVAVSDKDNHSGRFLAPIPQNQLMSFLNKPSDAQFPRTPCNNNTPAQRRAVQTWLTQHPNIMPLSFHWQQRTRFVGLDNSPTSSQGSWAVLDEDIRMAAAAGKNPQAREVLEEAAHSNIEEFPHAVLVVKVEGDDKGLLRVLDHSHLTERVPGFSVEAHALTTCCSSLHLPSPSWYQELQKDIRHIPSLTSTPGPSSRRTSMLNLSTTSHTPRRSSRSATSRTLTAPTSLQGASAFPNVEPSNAPALKSKKVTVSEEAWNLKQQRKQSQQPQPEQQYWNEYDYGSEYGDDQGFVIYVDPDAPVFPTLHRWTNKIKSIFSSRKSTSSTPKDADPLTDDDIERQLLNPSTNASSDALALTLTSDSSGDEAATPAKPCKKFGAFLHGQSRSTYGTTTTTIIQTRTMTKTTTTPPSQSTHISSVCLIASFLILAIVTMLGLSGRRKLRHEIDLAIMVAVVAAVGFSVVGVGSLVKMVGSREKVAWWWKGIVGTAFACVCVWGGGLVAWVVV